MYGQINDTKHTKTFISRPFGNLWTCGRSVIYIFFFAHGVHEPVAKKKNCFFFFFCSDAENNIFASVLMGRSGDRKQDYFFRPYGF